jgi:hypothetical protein
MCKKYGKDRIDNAYIEECERRISAGENIDYVRNIKYYAEEKVK